MKTYRIRLKWDGFKARPTRLAKGKYARLQGPGSVQIYRCDVEGTYSTSYCFDEFYDEGGEVFVELEDAVAWCEEQYTNHALAFLEEVRHED